MVFLRAEPSGGVTKSFGRSTAFLEYAALKGMMMGLQDAERGQMGMTRVQVIGFTHKSARGAGEESQRQVQEKEQSGDGEKSREKTLLPNGTRPVFLNAPYICESVRCPSEDLEYNATCLFQL